MYSIDTIIKIAKISLYLALNDVARGVMYGARLDPNLPRKIYIEYRILEWMYINNPTEGTLRQVANYVLELCGFYALEANVILNGGNSGGTVIPVGPSSNLSFPYVQFEVGQAGSLMNDGDTVLVISVNKAIQNSEIIALDNNLLEPNLLNTFSYTILYTATSITITFNTGVSNGQKFYIKYAKF